MIRPIPTRVGGIEFCSKLEANVAACLSVCGVEWVYEQEGYDLGEAGWYLPDFWLPKARQFVEVKGAADDPSLSKTRALASKLAEQGEDDIARVVVLAPPFVASRHPDLGPTLTGASFVLGLGLSGTAENCVTLVTCTRCSVPFFFSMEWAWNCTACGQHGKHYANEIHVWAEHKRGQTTYELAR